MNESVLKTLTVAFVVCLVCSLVVSSTAVSLRDMQNKNKLNDERMKILQSANMYDPSVSIESQFNQLEMKFVDFNTGKILDSYKDFDIQNYDQIAATRDSSLSTKIPTAEDIAIIKNRENVGKFYISRNDDLSIDKIILPIRGYGLWGTLFGYISIENDFNTVAGLEFYSHKETPGLGAEVDNPKWKALWPGKQLYKDDEVLLEVVKGKVSEDDSNLAYKVDGLSGATITSRGVSNMIKYWFSDSGYANLFSELDYES
jgi:Na+-transporting NADH:ubiquinone oxidoreductase subunit C